jgi:mercuric ion transport protein
MLIGQGVLPGWTGDATVPCMLQVELIYDDDCPNVALARSNLERAFSLVGFSSRWIEHRVGEDSVPEHARGYGSPTVLVNGIDVAPVEQGAEACCRVYEAEGRFSKAPDAEQIAKALMGSLRT